jgi:hypothetical protein
VDDEEDINKVTKYLSYEHFYVLYCRFWELDGDRDYRISREDLLKYGECLCCCLTSLVAADVDVALVSHVLLSFLHPKTFQRRSLLVAYDCRSHL